MGRNSDITFIRKILGWEPDTRLDNGLAITYGWTEDQYERRRAGEHLGIG